MNISEPRLSYVYILLDEEGAVGKIGTSINPEERRVYAGWRMKRKFRITWTHPGDESLEGFIQYLFVHLRIEGDWYDFSAINSVTEIADSMVGLWNMMGNPDDYAAKSFMCMKYPLRPGHVPGRCYALPMRRNILVHTDPGRG